MWENRTKMAANSSTHRGSPPVHSQPPWSSKKPWATKHSQFEQTNVPNDLCETVVSLSYTGPGQQFLCHLPGKSMRTFALLGHYRRQPCPKNAQDPTLQMISTTASHHQPHFWASREKLRPCRTLVLQSMDFFHHQQQCFSKHVQRLASPAPRLVVLQHAVVFFLNACMKVYTVTPTNMNSQKLNNARWKTQVSPGRINKNTNKEKRLSHQAFTCSGPWR